MKRWIWRAAVIAAFCLFGGAVQAQDVTLTARDGGIVLDGTLQGYDGEFYRIETEYGLLTVDGEGVICTGPACPDLTAPMAVVRIIGVADAGNALLPRLFAAYAAQRGMVISTVQGEGGFATEISDPVTQQPLAKISFAPGTPDAARAALAAGRAEMVVSAVAEKGFGARLLGLDALIPIVAVDNRLVQVSTTDLARALSGEVANWQEIGGTDMPVVLHAMAADTSMQEALAARLGRDVAAVELHPDLASLAAAVARDPYALAITAQSGLGAARALPLSDSCGFPLMPSRLGVKAEDYPLTLPIYLLTPKRRLPLFVREFLEFLALPEAQAAVAAAGFVDAGAERQPLTADGLRLMNAIRGAGEGIGLPELKRLTDSMAGADRLSLTFRFEDGSTTLDARSVENLRHLAKLMEVGAFRGQEMVLAGFSDGAGDAAANLELALSRSSTVAAALKGMTADLPEGQMQPRVDAFGEALPMACDGTMGGRRLNRRVELWLRPLGSKPIDSFGP